MTNEKEFPEILDLIRKNEKFRRGVKRALGEDLLVLYGPTAPEEPPEDATKDIALFRRAHGMKGRWYHLDRYKPYIREQARLRRSVRGLNDELIEHDFFPPLSLNEVKQALADARKRVRR
jgi:hypothetical protein